MSIKGTLIPIGGNEDKGNGNGKAESYTLEYIQESILSRIVRESGGQDALILIVTTASSIPQKVGQTYLEAFGSIGCKNLRVLDIRNRMAAELPEHIELMQKADCVMFSGGDQSLIINSFYGTQIEKILMERYRNERFVIAGTSAGAMCMSHEMIAGGGSRDFLRKGSVHMKKGMGFTPKLIIDSHFIRRHRFGRLAEAVARYPQLVGLGLSEDTGLVIRNGTEGEVIGSGMLVVMDPRKITHNNRPKVKRNALLSIANLSVHVLTSGDRLQIGENEISISLGNPIVLEENGPARVP